eukprot:CAMPEP_0175870084 /NCGR_PEP_ID=MMETSP0107_2-20121207/36351_1 /TAXON_ID=195067 ORGANISM="Goniomonas pacifica, Strain CCMP1869" /NCGR_SAMPLE_ID=MMETSP0107_2 /ASSEMBLY_ACC=CAM_ASM_000203 /LENGTH=31 /DNA_ID= /DNA_START= /DNA_END= /DNA_ORIENTATION=
MTVAADHTSEDVPYFVEWSNISGHRYHRVAT